MIKQKETQTYDSRPDTLKHIQQVQKLGGVALHHLNLIRSKMNALGDISAQMKMDDIICKFYGDIANHDQKKLQEPELSVYDECIPLIRAVKYGSPEYDEVKNKMDVGLKHHYNEYEHHPEHFEGGVQDMSAENSLEMVIDWVVSAGRIPGGEVNWDTNKNRFKYDEDFNKMLQNTAKVLQSDTSIDAYTLFDMIEEVARAYAIPAKPGDISKVKLNTLSKFAIY